MGEADGIEMSAPVSPALHLEPAERVRPARCHLPGGTEYVRVCAGDGSVARSDRGDANERALFQ